MEPSRKLDILVAEKIMGHKVFHDHGQSLIASGQEAFDKMITTDHLFWEGTSDENEYCLQLPVYSTDIAAAWTIIIKMHESGFGFTISDNANRYAEHIDCRFWHLDNDMRRGIAIKDKAPLAICLAALAALGMEVGNETK